MGNNAMNDESVDREEIVLESAPPAADPQVDPEAAKVRVRIKGEQDGPVFQGQVVIVPCLNCGRK